MLSRILRRHQGIALPGLPCGFMIWMLDWRFSTFSDYRCWSPVNGKTSFALNLAHNVAFHKLPVAIFSLEMSKEQLVQRLLTSEAGIESNRLRAGRVTQN